MYSKINNIEVIGIAAAVAEKWNSLKEICDEDPKFVEGFIKKTGVEGRYSASPRQTTADFCYAAAKELLELKKIDRKEIGVLVFVSQTADYRVPATACVLQHRLGLDENLIAFDVNLGCSGYVYGLNIVSSLMQTSEAKYGILLAGDTSARERTIHKRQKTNHSSSLLFGDAGTATLLRKAQSGEMHYALNTEGEGYKAIISPYGEWRNPDEPEELLNSSNMDDIGVFTFATNDVPKQINEYMEKMGTSPENYDCLVLHQANLMIMKRIAKKTGFPIEKLLISLDKFGNTSSASIPITLVKTYGGGITKKIERLMPYVVDLEWGSRGEQLL